MASTSRSASSSTEEDYDILTPTSSIPNTVKEPSKHERFCMLLAELEGWAPTVGRLRDHEMKQMSQFFGQKMDNLERYLPTGTEEQQTEALERLTKLRDGPLGIRGVSKLTLDSLIDSRIGALNDQDRELVAHSPNYEASDVTSTIISPAAADTFADDSANKPSIGRSCSMFRVDFDGLSKSTKYSTPTLRSTTTGCGQYEVHTNKGCFLRDAVESILLSEDNEVIVRLKDGMTWELEFENRQDAMAVASELAA